MKLGVVYLLTHMQLAARLVVSLYSLRRWYPGPVTVFTTRPDSHRIGEYCANDSRLRVATIRIDERPGKGHLSSYLTKTAILKHSPYEATIFLDADTLVAGDIGELLSAAQSTELTATNFCGWPTTQKPVSEMLRKWRELANTPGDTYDLEDRIEQLLSIPYPAVNSGVFAVQRSCDRLVTRWDDLTWMARDVPHPDEISLQLLLFEVSHRILGYQYNCHPSWYHPGIGARIWHFAGWSHLSHEECRKIWLPVYEACRREGVAKIADWSRIERTSHRGATSAASDITALT